MQKNVAAISELLKPAMPNWCGAVQRAVELAQIQDRLFW
jgi:hypothetical protein